MVVEVSRLHSHAQERCHKKLTRQTRTDDEVNIGPRLFICVGSCRPMDLLKADCVQRFYELNSIFIWHPSGHSWT